MKPVISRLLLALGASFFLIPAATASQIQYRFDGLNQVSMPCGPSPALGDPGIPYTSAPLSAASSGTCTEWTGDQFTEAASINLTMAGNVAHIEEAANNSSNHVGVSYPDAAFASHNFAFRLFDDNGSPVTGKLYFRVQWQISGQGAASNEWEVSQEIGGVGWNVGVPPLPGGVDEVYLDQSAWWTRSANQHGDYSATATAGNDGSVLFVLQTAVFGNTADITGNFYVTLSSTPITSMPEPASMLLLAPAMLLARWNGRKRASARPG